MSKASSNLRQRANGTWEGRFQKDGVNYTVYGRTKSEAKEKLTAKRAEIDQGIIDQTNMSVEEWGQEWLQTFKAGKVRHSTMDNYESDFRLHVVPYIGRIKLKDLTTFKVQQMYAENLKKGLSPKSIRNVHGMLHGMLDKAVKLDLIHKNVTENCELPALEKSEMYTLSDKELHTFLEVAKDDPFYLMYYVAFFTGLRESELIGLTWDCIDFENETIRIYRQFVRIASGPDKGKMMFTSLKNHKERTICPAPSVMRALRKVKLQQAEQKLHAGSSWINEYNMVFTRENGMFVRFKTLYLHFKDLAARIGRPEMRFHDIRHTYATLSIQSQVDIKTLSASLGHATVAFTLDTYGHVSNAMKQDAASKMESLIATL